MTVDELDAVEQIRQLKARYCRHVDLKQWAAWQACFTDDAVFVTGSGSTTGALAIRSMTRDTLGDAPTSHQAFLPEITLTSVSTAQGIWAAMFVLSAGPITGFGHYYDSYTKVADRWLISRSEVVTTLIDGTVIPPQLLDTT